ncbi:MAG: hypothetical protein ABL308_08945 [Oceanicaulis sp.]
MSEPGKLNPETVFERAIDRMTAFGYVDRGWIKAACYAFLDKQQKKKDKTEEKRSGFFTLIGDVFAALNPFRVPQDIPPSERDQRGRAHPAWLIVQAVLDQVPARMAQRAPAGGRRRKSLKEVLAETEAEDRELAAKFLRKSGLEETGFPVRMIGEGEETPRPVSASTFKTPETTAAKRGAALSTLTGGLLYRFAYDHDKKLKWEDTQKVFRASGLYSVYIVPPDPAYVERRLLLVRLDEDGAIVRAAEIRKPRDRFVVRGGYVIPASGVNTLILSSDFSPETLAEMIESELSAAARDLIFPDGTPEESQTSASFLQEHQLGFYSLFSRGEGELRGAVLEGPTPSTAVGYKIRPEDLDLTGERTPGLGFLEFDEIADRRDRILISAIGRNPAVSIDIG